MRETNRPRTSRVHTYLEQNHLVPDLTGKKGLQVFAELLRTLNHWAHKIILCIAEVALTIMVVVVITTVFMRYVLNTGIGWAEEVPRLLVVLFAFLASAIGVRDHMHISVNIIYNLFKENSKGRKALIVFSDLCIFICGLFLLVYGAQYTKRLMGLPGILPMTGWPTWIQYLPAPIAGFVIAFDSILFLTGVLDRNELLYSEPETDFVEEAKKQKEAAMQEGRS